MVQANWSTTAAHEANNILKASANFQILEVVVIDLSQDGLHEAVSSHRSADAGLGGTAGGGHLEEDTLLQLGGKATLTSS